MAAAPRAGAAGRGGTEFGLQACSPHRARIQRVRARMLFVDPVGLARWRLVDGSVLAPGAGRNRPRGPIVEQVSWCTPARRCAMPGPVVRVSNSAVARRWWAWKSRRRLLAARLKEVAVAYPFYGGQLPAEMYGALHRALTFSGRVSVIFTLDVGHSPQPHVWGCWHSFRSGMGGKRWPAAGGGAGGVGAAVVPRARGLGLGGARPE